MNRHAREPDPSIPFAGYAWDDNQPARGIGAELGSLADFSSESAADPPPNEAPRAAPHTSPTLAWLRQRSISIAPIWLVAVAIGGVAVGVGYSRFVRSDRSVDRRLAATDTTRPIEPTVPVASQPTTGRQPPATPPRNAAERSTSTQTAPKTIEKSPPSYAPPATDAPPFDPVASAMASPESEVLAPSAIAALPHVPVAPPLTPSAPPWTPSAPSPEPAEEPEGIREQRVIRSLLEAYRLAYERLDALAVTALWPGVDARSLTRAFNTLKSQQVTFDRCTITITGAVAVARCDGILTYARRIGESEAESRRMTWAFALERASGQWRIQRINSR